MKYKKILDMHTHTDNSVDGHHSIMLMCETAERKGLRAVAFTDHCEIDNFKKGNFALSTKQAYFEMSKARAVFMGRMLILAGIELGQQCYDAPTAERLLKTYNYDVVIGSIHNLRNEGDFFFMDFSKFSTQELDALMNEYFDELITLVKYGDFDILAHITYPLRYVYNTSGIKIDIHQRYGDKVEELLQRLVQSGKALEINTAGLRQKINDFSPEQQTVARFRELGGEYISIGSDAHYAEDIGAGIEEAMEMAHACGFKNVTFFQNRTPVQIPIE